MKISRDSRNGYNFLGVKSLLKERFLRTLVRPIYPFLTHTIALDKFQSGAGAINIILYT